MTISAVAQSKTWMEAVRSDLESVTDKMRSASFLDNHLLDASIDMILTAGGKRMRPAITLLVGKAESSSMRWKESAAASYAEIPPRVPTQIFPSPQLSMVLI